MILSFHIEYRTSWGEEVRVLGSILELGNNQPYLYKQWMAFTGL